MKRRICYVSAILLSLALLYGCPVKESAEEKNLRTLEQQFACAVEQQTNQKVYWKSGARHFGEYGQCHVFLMQYDGSSEKVVNVDKYTFRFSQGGSFSVYYNDTVYSLSDAYTQGIITDEQLMTLYNDYLNMEQTILKTESFAKVNPDEYCSE